MTYYERVRFAMHVVPLLYLTSLVALAAFVFRRREVFIAGVVGAVLGSLSPQPANRSDYSSVEGAAMAVFSEIYSHSLNYGTVGALAGVSAGILFVSLGSRRLPDQTTVAPSN
jgi:hypothetical protein